MWAMLPILILICACGWLYRQLIAEIRECTEVYDRLGKAAKVITELAAKALVDGRLTDEQICSIENIFPSLGDVYRNPAWIRAARQIDEAPPDEFQGSASDGHFHPNP